MVRGAMDRGEMDRGEMEGLGHSGERWREERVVRRKVEGWGKVRWIGGRWRCRDGKRMGPKPTTAGQSARRRMHFDQYLTSI
jgi:hypothetical protein